MVEVTDFKDIKRNKNWCVLLYGKPGTGKTSSVKNLNGRTAVLSLDDSSKVLEGLTNGTNFKIDQTKPSEELDAFMKNNFPKIQKDYDNLVIDNVSSLQSSWFAEMGRKSKNGISNEIQDYGKWTNYFNRLMSAFYNFNGNLLITAWEQQKPITTASGQMFNQYYPAIRDNVVDTISGLVDVVGRVIINPKTGNRGVILQGDDGVYAKNRLDDRTASTIDNLFKFGSDENGVSTISTPTRPSESSEK